MTEQAANRRSSAETRRAPGTKAPQYAVPAVEKALNIMELLSGSRNGMSMSEMVVALGKSMGELYRVVVYLERRGYLARDPDSDRYSLSLRLFEMSHRNPPTARLVKRAIPVLEALAEETEQSCHLGVLHDGMVLILATGINPRPMAYTVRIGALFPVTQTSSGSVILAHLAEEQRNELLAHQPGETLAEVLDRIALVKRIGYERHTSLAVAGIINLSFPVFDHSGIVGAMTIPFLEQVGLKHDEAAVLKLLGKAACELSAALGGGTRPDHPDSSNEERK